MEETDGQTDMTKLLVTYHILLTRVGTCNTPPFRSVLYFDARQCVVRLRALLGHRRSYCISKAASLCSSGSADGDANFLLLGGKEGSITGHIIKRIHWATEILAVVDERCLMRQFNF